MAKSDARLEHIPIELRFSRELLGDQDAVPSRRGWLAWLAAAMGDAFEIYGYDQMLYPYRDS
jgi:hypothetical protein